MTNVYFNHDGGVDDLVSLLLLLQMPEARVTGVSVVDGDCQIGVSQNHRSLWG